MARLTFARAEKLDAELREAIKRPRGKQNLIRLAKKYGINLSSVSYRIKMLKLAGAMSKIAVTENLTSPRVVDESVEDETEQDRIRTEDPNGDVDGEGAAGVF